MVTMIVETTRMKPTVLHQPVVLESFSVVAMPLAVYHRLGSVTVTLTVVMRVMRKAAPLHQTTNRPVQTLNLCVLTISVSTKVGSVMEKWTVMMDLMKPIVSTVMSA